MAGTEQTGEVRNSTGNGEAKGLTCATHGHEPGGDRWREGDTGQRGTEGHWDHCDSTTHTMHFTESSAGHREGSTLRRPGHCSHWAPAVGWLPGERQRLATVLCAGNC